MPDSEIDYGDIPPLDESFWKNAVRNPLRPPPRCVWTLIFWHGGMGLSTRINSILREAMLRSLHDKV